ncbi:MAG: hypothetical protein LBK03_00505, partial [Bacteroidales bacterium]|nr:hypothetical protein [Bacteroidales bacterium]
YDSYDLTSIQERYKNTTGFFSVHGLRRKISVAKIPIYSVDDFFSRNKKVMNKAKRGKPFFDMLPVF